MKDLEEIGVISWLINYKKIKKDYVELQDKSKNEIEYLRKRYDIKDKRYKYFYE